MSHQEREEIRPNAYVYSAINFIKAIPVMRLLDYYYYFYFILFFDDMHIALFSHFPSFLFLFTENFVFIFSLHIYIYI